MFAFFGKEHIKTVETNLYQALLVNSFIIPVLEIICYFTVKFGLKHFSFTYAILNKLILISYVTWILLFLLYVITIILKISKQKFRKFCEKSQKKPKNYCNHQYIVLYYPCITRLKFRKGVV